MTRIHILRKVGISDYRCEHAVLSNFADDEFSIEYTLIMGYLYTLTILQSA